MVVHCDADVQAFAFAGGIHAVRDDEGVFWGEGGTSGPVALPLEEVAVEELGGLLEDGPCGLFQELLVLSEAVVFHYVAG